jgi:hydrogenase maturation protease
MKEASFREMKILILGMGSPILSDDGVGLVIVRALKERIPNTDVITTTLVGLNLLDQLLGYDKLFLIDALVSGESRPGTLKKLKSGEGTAHLFTSHGLDFFTLLALGKQLGLKMPVVGAIYGIEIENPVSFGEELTPSLAEKLPSLIESIRQDIQINLTLS